MKKIVWLLVMFLLVGCAAPVTPVAVVSGTNVAPNAEGTMVPIPDKACVRPESDNSYHWSSNACVYVDTSVWTVKVRINDEMVNKVDNKSEGSAFAYGGYALASYRSWTEGKGQLPVIIISIEPDFPELYAGLPIVLKTSDSKAMALPNGAVTEFICNQDVEVLSPVIDWQVLTDDRLTYELDDCRMTYPGYESPEE